MRACEIAKLLAAQCESVVRELLPKGRRQGHEWKCGGVDGEPGDSLGVHMTGDKAGVWSDFSTGEKGDLIGLWMACRNISLVDACSEAMHFLGIREDRRDPPKKTWAKPERTGIKGLSDTHLAWLTNARALPIESIRAYKLATRGDAIVYPYFRGDDLVFAKFRKMPKEFTSSAGCEPIMFGWQAIRSNARSVCLTEGEMDAIAMHAYGFPSLSVPTGAGGLSWVDREYQNLERFDTIFVVFDTDEKGQDGVPELCQRLGRERCRVVILPRKDANACLMDGVSRDEIIRALRDSRTLDPAELRNAGEFEDAVIAEYSRVDEGMRLPWKKTHEDILLRAGETSVWAGINGHGKSVVVSNVVGWLASGGVRCCMASMEFRTAMWLMRMNKQIAASERPSEAYARHIMRKLGETMYVFDVSGKSKASRILEVFSYAKRRYDTQLFVIDNLTKCGFADDDYSGQKAFVEELSDFARLTQAHVAIVAHMRKGETEDKPQGKFSVKGSGGITDMVDTVIEVWRNKPLERAKKLAADTGTPLPEKYIDQSDTVLLVNKQRATGKEPFIGLWFDPASTQFLAGPTHTARPMIDYAIPVEKHA